MHMSTTTAVWTPTQVGCSKLTPPAPLRHPELLSGQMLPSQPGDHHAGHSLQCQMFHHKRLWCPCGVAKVLQGPGASACWAQLQ